MTTANPSTSNKPQAPQRAILSNEPLRTPTLDSSPLLRILNNPITFIKSSTTLIYQDLYPLGGFDFVLPKRDNFSCVLQESTSSHISESILPQKVRSGDDLSGLTNPPTDRSSGADANQLIDRILPNVSSAKSEPVTSNCHWNSKEEQATGGDVSPELVIPTEDVGPVPCRARCDPPEYPIVIQSHELGKTCRAKLESSNLFRKRKATNHLEKEVAKFRSRPSVHDVKKSRRLRVKGIRNPLNLCYRNSVLQLVSTCDAIRSVGQQHRSHPRNCVLCGLAAFYADHFREKSQSPGVNASVKELASFRKALPPPFNQMSDNQEDAVEYLMALLDTAERQSTENIPNAEGQNVVREVFGGCYPTVLECTNCGHKSTSPEDSTILQLGPIQVINSTEVVNMLDQIKEVFRPEIVEWHCDKCRSNSGRKRKIISVAPEYLLINIPRHDPFAWESSAKARNRVAFGETLRVPVGGSAAHYELVSVVAHAGSDMTSGHYVAYVRQPDYTWAWCNDSQVEQVSWNQVSTCTGGSYQACIVGYRRM